MGVRIMARKSGLNPERDITVVEARPPFLAGMVRDNKIQSATLFQPFFEEAMAKGDLKVLYTSSDIYGGPTDYVFMVVRRQVPEGESAAPFATTSRTTCARSTGRSTIAPKR